MTPSSAWHLAWAPWRKALALCTLCAATTLALGQPATRPANTKVMTKAELRACLKEEDGLKAQRAPLIEERRVLDADKAAIAKDTEALKGAADALDRTSLDAVDAHNAKIRAHDARIDAWNERSNALGAKGKGYEQAHEAWKASCANRRYNEDDEKAIRAGR